MALAEDTSPLACSNNLPDFADISRCKVIAVLCDVARVRACDPVTLTFFSSTLMARFIKISDIKVIGSSTFGLFCKISIKLELHVAQFVTISYILSI